MEPPDFFLNMLKKTTTRWFVFFWHQHRKNWRETGNPFNWKRLVGRRCFFGVFFSTSAVVSVICGSVLQDRSSGRQISRKQWKQYMKTTYGKGLQRPCVSILVMSKQCWVEYKFQLQSWTWFQRVNFQLTDFTWSTFPTLNLIYMKH